MNNPTNFLDAADLDFARRLAGAGCQAGTDAPVLLDPATVRSFLVLAPHQDDESIGAGGALSLAAQAGARIHVCFLTDGGQAGGPWSLEESIALRDSEARAVCHGLGASKHDLGIANFRPNPGLEHVRRLAEIVRLARPEVVLLPWILDRHKHRLAAHLLHLAHRLHGLPDFTTWGYQVYNEIYATGVADISSVLQRKQELMAHYRTQNQYYRRYDHIALGLAAWNSRFLPMDKGAPRAAHAECFHVLPRDEYLRLVETCYLPDLDATYAHDPRYTGPFKALQQAADAALQGEARP